MMFLVHELENELEILQRGCRISQNRYSLVAKFEANYSSEFYTVAKHLQHLP